MKFKNAVILLITSLIFTSCFNTTDELWIEKDGSGHFQTTTDLSSVYPFMMMGLEKEKAAVEDEEMKNDDEAKKEGKTKKGDEMKEMFENLLKSERMDTTFVIEKLVQAGLDEKGMTMDDFWAKVDEEMKEDESMPDAQKEVMMSMFDKVMNMKFRLQANKGDGMFKTTLIQSFSSVSELSNLGKDMADVLPYLDNEKADNMTADQLASMDQLFNSFTHIDLSGNTLSIRRSGLDLSSLGEEVAQMAPMMQMFLGSSPYRLVVHLPGKVKKMSAGVEKIDKNTVAIEMSLNDLFDAEKSIDYEVTFKGLK